MTCSPIIVTEQLGTSANIDRKRAGALEMTIAAEDKQLIIESKRHRKKAAAELIIEQFLLMATSVALNRENHLRSAGFQWIHSQEKTFLRKVNKQKRKA